MKNQEIYTIATNLNQEFANCELYIPIKANFAIQKNIKALTTLAQEIEQSRINIAKEYGTLNEDGQMYSILPEKMEIASKELTDLFDIDQDININKVRLEDFGDVAFTPAQMQALMFMIEEE